MSPPLLDVRDLSVRFPTPSGPIEAVSGVSFTVYPGETLAVVGESGSGKSVSSLAVLGLLGGGRATGGSIRFQGEELVGADPERLRRLRGAEIAMIFQNPMSSLDPLFTVGDQIAEALRIHRPISRRDARRRAVELLTEVGLPDPARRVRSYPHELSGGQQQRVMIAMALACEPAAAHRRRADHRPRRHRRGPDPRAPAPDAARPRHRAALRHPRHGRGRGDG
jgi:ABC-type microcin C transport system duplicated ATPase subunit YejF